MKKFLLWPLLWLMCLAIQLCLVSLFIAWSGVRIDGPTTWKIILFSGTFLWLGLGVLCFFFRLVQNRYRLRKRAQLIKSLTY